MSGKKLNLSKGHGQERALGKGNPVYEPADMDLKVLLDGRTQAAKNNLKAWVEWYKATYRTRVPTRVALAKELGVTGGAITQLLNPKNSGRGVSLRTLVAVKRLLGDEAYTIDALLFTPPPPLPPGETTGGHSRSGRGKR